MEHNMPVTVPKNLVCSMELLPSQNMFNVLERCPCDLVKELLVTPVISYSTNK